jgi:hypothetical protein
VEQWTQALLTINTLLLLEMKRNMMAIGHAYILIHMALLEFPLCDKDIEFYQLQEITYPKREQLKKNLEIVAESK